MQNRIQPHMPRPRAFTLIELLVVISIIVLLIGILLPVLGAARSAARGAVCLANLRSAGQGMHRYATDYDGALAGPSTSGAELTRSGRTAYRETAEYPVQNFDWISPTLGDSLGLPGEDGPKLAPLFNNEFRCPENEETYSGSAFGDLSMPVPAAATPLTVNSYSAINQFLMVWPADAAGRAALPPEAIFGPTWMQAVVEPPDTYRPHLDFIRNPVDKLNALDGSRYVDRNTNEVTFNGAAVQFQGGNFGTFGPSMGRLIFNGTPYKRDTDADIVRSERYAFRHDSNNGLNGMFFDGHAEAMTVADSQRVEHSYPSGSIVRNASRLYDTSVANGDVIR